MTDIREAALALAVELLKTRGLTRPVKPAELAGEIVVMAGKFEAFLNGSRKA